MSKFIKQLYGVDIADHTEFACLGLVWGLIAMVIAGNMMWDWGGWSWFFCVPGGIFFLLFFRIAGLNKDRKLLASLSIVYGYVQKVEKWERDVSESGKVQEQSIVVGETRHSDQGDSIELQSHSDEIFNVTEGNVVIVAFGEDTGKEIIDLRKVQEKDR